MGRLTTKRIAIKYKMTHKQRAHDKHFTIHGFLGFGHRSNVSPLNIRDLTIVGVRAHESNVVRQDPSQPHKPRPELSATVFHARQRNTMKTYRFLYARRSGGTPILLLAERRGRLFSPVPCILSISTAGLSLSSVSGPIGPNGTVGTKVSGDRLIHGITGSRV